ncbi:Xaa-Pro peptidase family protein [Actinocorallia sp. A-T 12471]|uniref:M24 family metallopeptidase n=1 Tax=Actinocorallia sp. A-T 12471 TaxID=3089813 RepID=UPI0029D10BB5|nr:Xaa-Pro peptidase family protein [Actinocorallia sp. A-T 12471]MDX6744260.1 Xaa-Pro peptidase family protein [Actinocorallia sp. A-T 12471]
MDNDARDSAASENVVTTTALYPPERITRVREAVGRAGLDAVVLTPGPDLRYVTGYDAHLSERLTCLVVPAQDEAFLVTPRLELAVAEASPAGGLGLEITSWQETEDPFALVAARLAGAARVAVADHMWAAMAFRLRDALPGAALTAAGGVLRELRMRKSGAEIEALRQAGAAIDRVHRIVPQLLKAGRTEAEVGRDIAEAILAEGHVSVDFTIVGSGPNGASPHHELSDRVIGRGEPVVVDIGGTMPSGYCSDSTRVYSVGQPPQDFLDYYAVLRDAQEAAVEAVRPGVTPEAVDAAARDVIAAAGYGEYFLHRTGHGIGLETHEHPYIVEGNTEPLAEGMAFSIEPGIYPGAHGARIEDIVVCTGTGADRMNLTPRDLVVIDG